MTTNKDQHEKLTQSYSTWGDKLLQHTDVLYSIQRDKKFKPITIQLSPCEACFSGDTEVSLLDGTTETLASLAARTEPFWVYSYDTEAQRIVPGKALRSRMTRHAAKTITVTLDDGSKITCTPDHRFLMRDGTYREAQDLTPGTSLMPLYRRISEKTAEHAAGYEEFLEPTTEEWTMTHQRVEATVGIATLRFINGKMRAGDRDDETTVRHHVNVNKRDNRPENLAWMTFGEHHAYHASLQAEKVRLGTHPFQSEEHHFTWGKYNRKHAAKGTHPSQLHVADGTHHFLTDEFKQRTSELNKQLAAEGRLNLQTDEHRKNVSDTQNRMLKEGTHYFKSEEHKQRSRDRMKMIRKWDKHLFQNGLTKEDLPFAAWKAAYVQDATQPTNHKVVSIKANETQDVYCLEVERYHNFALQAGVFVANCDSDCPFCSVADRPLKSYMKFAEIKQVLTDFRELGAKSVEITGGGNPMLYKDKETKETINDVIRFAHGLGYNIGIITNSESLKRLEPDTHGMISWIRISLIKLDEGKKPEDYDFCGFPYEKLAFSYIIYEECASSPIRGKLYEGTSEETIERIAQLVELHQGQIKFVRFAGNCLVKGNNMLVRKNFEDVVEANDKYKKFFIKTIYDNDNAYNDGCYVGLIRPYVAASPDGDGYMVYTCTSHVLNTRTYDKDYALCKIADIKQAWADCNARYAQGHAPYEVKCNGGKDWEKTCKFCYYFNSNKILHTVTHEMPDKDFP